MIVDRLSSLPVLHPMLTAFFGGFRGEYFCAANWQKQQP